MEQPSHTPGLLLVFSLSLLAAVLQPSGAWPTRKEQREERIINMLGDALHRVLTNTCAAHNMSVYVSTRYQQEMPGKLQLLVVQVLESGFAPRHNDKDNVVPLVMDTLILSELSLHMQLLLFFVQDAQQLAAAASENARGNPTHKFNYLVVLLTTEQDHDAQQAEMSKIFSCLLHRRYNVNVVLLLAQLQAATLRAYTFWPYRSKPRQLCESTQPFAISLQDTRLNDLFPQKLNNLHGCPLHVIVWQIPPFMKLHPQQGTTNVIERIDGLDAEMLKMLASQLNFSISLVRNEPEGLIGGASYANGTMTGAFLMLLQHRANLTIGFTACMPVRSKYLASTLPYSQVEYILVLHAAQPYSSYEIMLFPFETGVWLLMVFLAALRLLCWLRGWRLKSPMYVGWLHILFVLRIGYESSVFMFVHNAPTRPLPHSLDEALAQDYSFVVDHATYRMTEMLPAVRARTSILPGQAVDIFDQLLAMPPHQQRRTAALSSQHFLRYYLSKAKPLIGQRQHNNLIRADKKIMDNMVCVHFPLGSYMAGVVNQQLFNMRSSGISQHISERLGWSRLDTTSSVRWRPLHGSSTHSHDAQYDESMRFILSAFYCLLIAESVTIVIFFLELLSLRSNGRLLSSIFNRV